MNKEILNKLYQKSIAVNAGGKGCYSPYNDEKEWSDDIDILLEMYQDLQNENKNLKKIISDNTILIKDETGPFEELNVKQPELLKYKMRDLKEKLNNYKKYDKYELLNELNNIGKEMYEIPLFKEYGELFRLYEKTYNTHLFASEKGE